MYGGDNRNLHPVTVEEVERWFQRYSSAPQCWVVEVARRCVGNARLDGLDKDNRSARYAAGLFDATIWGQGLLIGVNVATVFNWETGRHQPRDPLGPGLEEFLGQDVPRPAGAGDAARRGRHGSNVD